MRVSAILLAAGIGRRFKSRLPKPVFKINGRPMVTYALAALQDCALVHEVILVTSSRSRKAIERLIARGCFGKVKKIVAGGARRQDSVRAGLQAVDPGSAIVLIHDSARPFIDRKIIASCIDKAVRSGAAIAAVPVKATIKRAHAGRVAETLKREQLWEVQTPQVFKKKLLCQAFDRWGRFTVTDDASLVEKLGKPVHIVTGSYDNIKITTPEDVGIARGIIAKRGKARYGK